MASPRGSRPKTDRQRRQQLIGPQEFENRWFVQQAVQRNASDRLAEELLYVRIDALILQGFDSVMKLFLQLDDESSVFGGSRQAPSGLGKLETDLLDVGSRSRELRKPCQQLGQCHGCRFRTGDLRPRLSERIFGG